MCVCVCVCVCVQGVSSLKRVVARWCLRQKHRGFTTWKREVEGEASQLAARQVAVRRALLRLRHRRLAAALTTWRVNAAAAALDVSLSASLVPASCISRVTCSLTYCHAWRPQVSELARHHQHKRTVLKLITEGHTKRELRSVVHHWARVTRAAQAREFRRLHVTTLMLPAHNRATLLRAFSAWRHAASVRSWSSSLLATQRRATMLRLTTRMHHHRLLAGWRAFLDRVHEYRAVRRLVAVFQFRKQAAAFHTWRQYVRWCQVGDMRSVEAVRSCGVCGCGCGCVCVWLCVAVWLV